MCTQEYIAQLRNPECLAQIWDPDLHKTDPRLQPKEATESTKKINAAYREKLPLDDQQNFEDALQGRIAELPTNPILTAQGKVVWDPTAYNFLEGEAPDSVNPSLWRMAKLLNITGLFEVTEGIYQVRGLDLSNITFIETDNGVIVMDPLVSEEVARAALELYWCHRPKKPVIAGIYSHAHLDHFGGARGVFPPEDLAAGRIQIIAPEGFDLEALSENVLAGNRMSRLATYMYGKELEPGPKGHVTAGLGLTISHGTVTYVSPNDYIRETGEKRVVDGLEIEFLVAPDSECRATIHFAIPKYRAICLAENATCSHHHVGTPRGAQVRDAKAWAGYCSESLERWEDMAEVMYSPHHWPTWTKERIVNHVKNHIKSISAVHNQALNMANQGYTMTEAAEKFTLPHALEDKFETRGYYGQYEQNVKSVFVKYLGNFDGNPASLQPLPFAEASRRYVELMGGAERIINIAKQDYERGDYRWVAQLVNHVVFADPLNVEARALQADALEQLGYQMESGAYRSFYLTGAKELREGVPNKEEPESASPDIISHMPLDTIFDFMAVRLSQLEDQNKFIKMNWNFTDTGQSYGLSFEDTVLSYSSTKLQNNPHANVTMERKTLNDVMNRQATLQEKIQSGEIVVEGDCSKFLEFLAPLLIKYKFWFPIVTPRDHDIKIDAKL